MRRRSWLGAITLLVVVALAVSYAGRGHDPVIRTVSVGPFAVQLVADAQTDRVFVANSHGDVIMLDAASGRVISTIPIHSQPGDVVLDTITNRVFVLSDAGGLTGSITILDAARGTVLRTVPAAVIEAVVDDQSGRVIAATRDPQNDQYDGLVFFDGRAAALLRNVPFLGPDPPVLAVDARTRHIFAASWDHSTVSMLDARTGRLIRMVRVGYLPAAIAVDTRTDRVLVSNNGSGTVSVLDARSGALLKTVNVGKYPARVVVDEYTDRVFVVHGRGNGDTAPYQFPDVEYSGVTMLDARTGRVLRSLSVGGSPIDDSGRATTANIVLDSRYGRVYVINPPTHDSNGLPVDGYGSVSVLDARSGNVLRTIAVGWNPLALAVDETRSRLFVLNTNSGCIPGHNSLAWVPASVRRWLPFLPAPSRPVCNAPASVTVIDASHL